VKPQTNLMQVTLVVGPYRMQTDWVKALRCVEYEVCRWRRIPLAMGTALDCIADEIVHEFAKRYGNRVH